MSQEPHFFLFLRSGWNVRQIAEVAILRYRTDHMHHIRCRYFRILRADEERVACTSRILEGDLRRHRSAVSFFLRRTVLHNRRYRNQHGDQNPDPNDDQQPHISDCVRMKLLHNPTLPVDVTAL